MSGPIIHAGDVTAQTTTALGAAITASGSLTNNSMMDLAARAGSRIIENNVAFTAAGATTNIFSFTGPFRLDAIYGIFNTVTDSTSCAAASLNVWDATNTVQLTSVAGVDASAAVDQAMLVKVGNAAAALTFLDADQVRIDETVDGVYFPTLVNAKEGVTNYVRFVYTSGTAVVFSIRFVLLYQDLSQSVPAALAAV